MKVSFSLARKPAETPSPFQLKKPSAPVQKPALFNADDDDDGGGSLVPDQTTSKGNGIGLQTVSAETSKAQKKRELAEMAVDSTVYQYDEVWDKLQVAKQKVKEAKVAESKERKVRLPALSLHISECTNPLSFRSPSTSGACSRPPRRGNWTASERRKR